MGSWSVTEPRELRLEESVSQLDVSLAVGRLNVVGGDGPARVQIGKLRGEPVLVTVEDGVLRIRHEPLDGWPNLLRSLWWWRGRSRADVSIVVPVETACRLRVVSGPLVVSGIAADLRVACVSGRVTLLGNSGKAWAKITSGPIEALGCSGELNLETISGEITLADSATDRVTARTISGAVTADLDNPSHDGFIGLETVSGEITIRVREDSDLRVALRATSGHITSAFVGLGGTQPTKSLHGKLGRGTGQLEARAISGNIALLSRPVDQADESVDQAEEAGE